MKYKIFKEFPNPVLLQDYKVAVSIYMPTHRISTEQERDILVYKNLVKEIDTKLEQSLNKKEAKALSSSLHELEKEYALWNESLEGLVVFATLDFIGMYRLPETFEPLATIGTQFHLVPLLQAFQTHTTVLLLALNADRFHLYKADPYGITPVELPDTIPSTLEDVLGHHHTDKYHTHGSYGSPSNRSTFHGHGGAPAGDELDQSRFFQAIDQSLSTYLPDTYQMPVILVALDHIQAEFMKHASNSTLESPGILASFDDLSETEVLAMLHERALQAFDEEIQPMIERYHALLNDGLSAPDSTKLHHAIPEGRVDTLLIAAETNGSADHINTMLHQALAKGTHVYVLDHDAMPEDTNAAGLLRY
jgi:hypothetical protein